MQAPRLADDSFVQVGVQPGRGLVELSAEEKELLSEAYSADPTWSSKVLSAPHVALARISTEQSLPSV